MHFSKNFLFHNNYLLTFFLYFWKLIFYCLGVPIYFILMFEGKNKIRNLKPKQESLWTKNKSRIGLLNGKVRDTSISPNHAQSLYVKWGNFNI